MTADSSDQTRQTWFRLLIGMVWVVALALAGVGIYTVAPPVAFGVVASGYVVGTIVFGIALVTIALVISRFRKRGRPNGYYVDQLTAVNR
jgi:hypothetical protein